MTKQKAKHNGFILVVRGEGTIWGFEIFDPNAPEAHPLGTGYVDIDQAKDAAVDSANRHLATNYSPERGTNDRIVWYDIE